MSNAERQHKFQRAHPGYDRRRKARGRASGKRLVEMMKAQWRAELLAEQAQTVEATIQVPATKPLLMLPAPVENPLMVELEALAAARKSQPAESRFVPAFAQSQ